MHSMLLAVALAASAFVSLPAQSQTSQAQAYRIGNGVSSPVLVSEVKPIYPADAKREKVQGTVRLEGIVETTGGVTSITVKKSLDPRLDAAAVKALSQWRFKPGEKEGKPVRVWVPVEMSFTVR